jgi:hypothetical protein
MARRGSYVARELEQVVPRSLGRSLQLVDTSEIL